MKICFLVGSMKISGGTYVIVQHAHYLQSIGHEVELGVQEAFEKDTYSWHDLADQLIVRPIAESFSESYDLVVATWWKTALELYRFEDSRLAYFVQSIESRFYPEEEVPLRQYIDRTYDLDVSFCTEAVWIKDYLKENHGKDATLVRNGIRKDLYYPPNHKRNTRSPRVLIEGPFRVGFKNTGMAVAAAKKAGANDIWVLTGTKVKYVPFADKVFSQVPISTVPDIYRECDILIKLSTVEGMFGPPLEMFHCGGTAIVLNVTGHDEYIVDQFNAAVVESRAFSVIVEQIRSVLTNAEKVALLRQGAAKTAANWPDWDASSSEFANWIESVRSKHTNKINHALEVAEQTYIDAETIRLSSNKTAQFKNRVVARLTQASPFWAAIMFQLIAVKEVLLPFPKAR